MPSRRLLRASCAPQRSIGQQPRAIPSGVFRAPSTSLSVRAGAAPNPAARSDAELRSDRRTGARCRQEAVLSTRKRWRSCTSARASRSQSVTCCQDGAAWFRGREVELEDQSAVAARAGDQCEPFAGGGQAALLDSRGATRVALPASRARPARDQRPPGKRPMPAPGPPRHLPRRLRPGRRRLPRPSSPLRRRGERAGARSRPGRTPRPGACLRPSPQPPWRAAPG